MTESVHTDPNALEEVRKRRLLIDRCDTYLFEQLEAYIGQRVLEVGCGHGNLIPHLLNRQLIVATDVESSSVDEVCRSFGSHSNVHAEVCDITTTEAMRLKRHACDTVICLNALEHIESDGIALAHMQQILEPGGRVIIIVPAFQFLYGTMDSSIGHYRRYTKVDLAGKLQAAGLHVEKQYYFNLLGVVGWFVNGRVLHQSVPPSSQLRLYNLVFPVASKIESWLPRPVGLSLVSISRRV